MPAAAGAAVTVTVDVLVDVPLGPVTVKLIVFVPDVVHDIVCGPAAVLLATEASAPKFHA